MLVERLHNEASGQCGYLIGSTQDGVAALVDPFEGSLPRFKQLAQEHRLKIVMVLQTRVPSPSQQGQRPYSDLLAELGLQEDGGSSQDHDYTPWQDLDCERIGPVPSWPTEDQEVGGMVLLEFGERMLEILPTSQQLRDDDWFVRGEEPDAFRLSYHAARLRLGASPIEVLPIHERLDAVAYLIGGRLFTGLPIDSPRDGTPPSLLHLDPDFFVYAGQSDVMPELRTLRQELETRRQEPELVGDEGWTPVLHLGGAEDGAWGNLNPAGYRDLEPADALPRLHRFRIVDVRQRRRVRAVIDGAELVEVSELKRQASSWDLNAPILVISESGLRCGAAAAMLRRLGGTRVHRLVGGMSLWTELGLPVAAREPSAGRASHL